ncbi:TPA: inorganic pyrophosphatase, partial [Campylobacter upsaliensis]|nr:inorganic pyrophosphatase [Campylobacter upsaliensis]
KVQDFKDINAAIEILEKAVKNYKA